MVRRYEGALRERGVREASECGAYDAHVTGNDSRLTHNRLGLNQELGGQISGFRVNDRLLGSNPDFSLGRLPIEGRFGALSDLATIRPERGRSGRAIGCR